MNGKEKTTNASGNRPFTEIACKRISRRDVVRGGLGAAAASIFGAPLVSAGCAQRELQANSGLITFRPVAPADGKGPVPTISDDYEFQVLIPWGDPLQPGGPAFRYPPASDDQAEQIGIGHDGMTYFPLKSGRFGRGGNEHGMLAINHEFGSNTHLLGKPLPENLDDVRTSQLAHGVSIVEIHKLDGVWQPVASPRARRIHANSEVTFSGPAAGHALLETGVATPPLGTFSNCAGGQTPWGAYLTCEENFVDYFAATGDFKASEADERYRINRHGAGYGWHLFDPRFDLSNADYTNEVHRHGWVVEIDPMDADQTPVKRTALGRFLHEGAGVTVGRGGRVVVYMGDDERFNYIFKFVSDGNWETMRAQNVSPLDAGQLYVARFNDDGTGEWLALTLENPALAAAFSDQAEILIFARMAADLLGATPMDRPEWTTVAPNGDVYCSLTNNIERSTAHPANPMAPNLDGHIIRWRDTDDHIGTDFTWDIFLIAESTHGTEDTFSDPDGLWADPDGRLFIQTDGAQKNGLNNQLLVADTRNGELRRLFTGVTGDEITGITVTPDRRTMFINIQHPGDGDPALTNFPAPQDGVTVPRDCTIALSRRDGGIVGS